MTGCEASLGSVSLLRTPLEALAAQLVVRWINAAGIAGRNRGRAAEEQVHEIADGIGHIYLAVIVEIQSIETAGLEGPRELKEEIGNRVGDVDRAVGVAVAAAEGGAARYAFDVKCPELPAVDPVVGGEYEATAQYRESRGIVIYLYSMVKWHE